MASRWLDEHPGLRQEPKAMSEYLAGLYQQDPAKARRYLTEHATEDAIQSEQERSLCAPSSAHRTRRSNSSVVCPRKKLAARRSTASPT